MLLGGSDNPLRSSRRLLVAESSRPNAHLLKGRHNRSSTADRGVWYTGRPCAYSDRSHINFCVFDSTWEASEAFELDHNPYVEAWVKNDHLGFEIHYLYRGVVRKYRPDFLIRLISGEMLVLETKGQDTEQDKTKRRSLDEWVQAVNAHGQFGAWSWDVSKDPGDIKDILARHSMRIVAETPVARSAS